MFRTTLKGIAAHKVRLFTTTLAVLLGVAFMAGTLVLTDTVGRTFDSLMADTNAGTDAVVRSGSAIESEFGDQRGTIPPSLTEEILLVDGVAAAGAAISGSAQLVAPDGDVLGSATAPTLGGSWATVPELNPYTLTEGRPPRDAAEVVVDRGSATSGDLAVGDPVRVLTADGSREMTVSGIVAFGDSDSPAGASVALFDLATAQALLGTEGQVSQIAVVAADGVSQAELAERLAGALGDDGLEVLTGEAYADELRSDVQEGLAFFNSPTFLLVFAGVALFVGSFIIANTFSIIVAQRTRELALLRAIGASRRQVLASVLLEATVVGVVASTAGLVAGIGVASGLQALLGAIGLEIPASGTSVATSTVVASFVVGVGITLASATFPALRASKVPPIAALRDVALDRSGTSIPRMAGGVALGALGAAALALGLFGDGGNRAASVGAGAVAILLAVALLGPVIAAPVSRALGFPVARLRGVSGRLARENTARNPRRTSATAAALMIGVSLVGCITIVAASVKASIDELITEAFAGDLVVASEGMVAPGFSTALTAELDDLPETDAVVGLYEHDELAGPYVVDLATWEANVATQLDTQVYLTFADGVDLGEGRAAVEAVTAGYPSSAVQDIDEYRSAQTSMIDQLLTLIYALLALAVIIALLGIANTLALSVLERTRELGLLRAVGMSRPQLRSTIRWESVLIALLGTVLGLAIGIGFGSALVSALATEGLTAFVVPPAPLVVITLMAAGAGMLAAARPASRAAKLDILGAIAEA